MCKPHSTGVLRRAYTYLAYSETSYGILIHGSRRKIFLIVLTLNGIKFFGLRHLIFLCIANGSFTRSPDTLDWHRAAGSVSQQCIARQTQVPFSPSLNCFHHSFIVGGRSDHLCLVDPACAYRCSYDHRQNEQRAKVRQYT